MSTISPNQQFILAELLKGHKLLIRWCYDKGGNKSVQYYIGGTKASISAVPPMIKKRWIKKIDNWRYTITTAGRRAYCHHLRNPRKRENTVELEEP